MFSLRTVTFAAALAFQATVAYGIDVLFVGNSFTHGNISPVQTYNAAAITDLQGTGYGGIPGVFKKLSVEGGYSNINVTIEAISGERLTQHYSDQRTKFGRTWDWVVLQEYSTFPTSIPVSNDGGWTGGNIPWFRQAVSDLSSYVRSYNPAVNILLYETWARPDKVAASPDYVNTFYTTLQAMQSELQTNYAAAATDYSSYGIAWVGDAFMRAVQDGVGYDALHTATPPAGAVAMWASDNYHPSKYGSYLSACVFYAKILGGDPRNLPTGTGSAASDLGISASVADSLQNIAYIMTPATPPSITVQPTSKVAFAGQSVTLNVGATGNSLSYQWYKNGAALGTGTSSTLTLSNLQSSDAGYYQAKVTDVVGQIITSATATVTLATGSSSRTVYVDLGSTTTASPWTNLTQPPATASALLDTTGSASSISVASSGFNGSAVSGGMSSMSGTAATIFGGTQANAITDYWYVSSGTGTLTFSGLSTTRTYNVSVIASRNSSGTRTGVYAVTGGGTAVSGTLDATFNTSNVLTFNNVTPTSGGVLTLATSIATGNTTGFAYLNAVAITESSPVATGYAVWNSSNGLSGTTAQTDADPDGDGVSNLMEYALGGSVFTSDASRVPTPTPLAVSGTQYLSLQVAKNTSTTNLTYAVEVSSDLSHWYSGSPYTVTIADTTSTLQVRDATPITSGSNRYMRLRVTGN